MRAKTSLRFWMELAGGGLSLLLLAATTLWPQWIEAVCGVDPDSGDGAAERALTIGLLVCAVVMFVAARLEWRRAVAARTPV